MPSGSVCSECIPGDAFSGSMPSAGDARSADEVALQALTAEFDFAVDKAGNVELLDRPQRCDACPLCADTCLLPDCASCAEKRERLAATLGDRPRAITMCELRRHRTRSSAWLRTGARVYDVTSFLPEHPAGERAILRHAGGEDVTRDFMFHTKATRRAWAKYHIGRLVPCAGEDAFGLSSSPTTVANCTVS